MKTTSLKTIYLKQHELKEAIIQHLFQCGHKELAEHLNMNECEMAWSQSGKEFIVGIEGEVEDMTIDIERQDGYADVSQ